MQKRNSANIKGCDVSHWQGQVDWRKVKEGGIEFVYIKATEGMSYIDPLFEANVKGAKEASLYVGAYHFARFQNKQEAIREARHFFTTTKPHRLDLPHVLDIETNQGLEAESLTLSAFVYMETLQTLTDLTPMVYTSTQFAKDHLTVSLKKYPLWIAHFRQNQPGENGIWENWAVFQYTNKGAVSGIKGEVDLDEWEANDFNQRTANAESRMSAFSPPQRHLVLSTTTYKILKGDTFWGLEVHFGWTHGILQTLNPGVNPRKLSIGQTITVPVQKLDHSF